MKQVVKIFMKKQQSKKQEEVKEVEVIEHPMDRYEIQSILSSVNKRLRYKFLEGRITNVENEKIRVQIAKTLIQGLKVQNDVLKDEQMDLMLKELKEIKQSLNQKELDGDIEEDLKVVEETIQKLEGDSK